MSYQYTGALRSKRVMSRVVGGRHYQRVGLLVLSEPFQEAAAFAFDEAIHSLALSSTLAL